MTGAWNFDLVAFGSCGIPPFEVRVDGPIVGRHDGKARFCLPRGGHGRRGGGLYRNIDLRVRHQLRLSRWQIRGEIGVKL